MNVAPVNDRRSINKVRALFRPAEGLRASPPGSVCLRYRASGFCERVASGMARLVFLLLGLASTAMGVIGAFVPLLPTTVFLIIAAACFARSSPRLEAWILAHGRFGPLVRAWRDNGAIPRKAKLLACGGMAIGFAVFFVSANPGLWLALGVAAGLAACAIFVVSRPEPSP